MLNIDRLAERRLFKKFTHKEMAHRLGITRQGYGNYESGKRDVDTETLVRISEILETNSAYLLGETDDPSPNKDASEVPKEQAEFEAFINNPEYGIFFKDYLSAPDERKKELMQFWRFIQETEKERKPGQRQGE